MAPPHHNITFLSCDTAFVDAPPYTSEDEKRREQLQLQQQQQQQAHKIKFTQATTATLPTLSEHFRTDCFVPVQRMSPPRAPCPLCRIGVHTASLLGSSLFVAMVLLVTALSIVFIVHSGPGPSTSDSGRIILIASVVCVVLIGVAALFMWGVLSARHRLMIPFLFFAIVIFFGVVGVVAVLLLTIETSTWKNSGIIAQEVLVRIIPAVISVFQAYFIFCYVRTFIFFRRQRHESS